MDAQPSLGGDTLRLLADEGMPEIVRDLGRGPVRADEIPARLPGIPRWTAARRLRALRRAEFAVVVTADSPGGGPGAHTSSGGETYALSELGREWLPAVLAAAVDWERAWSPRTAGTDVHTSGRSTVRLLARPLNRAIIDALADVALRSSELEVRLPHATHSTLMRRLSMLSEQDILVRSRRHGDVRYALSDCARRLPSVSIRAAHCEWCREDRNRREGRAGGPILSGNLPVVLHMLAPLGRVSADVRGACRWRVESEAGPHFDIYLAAARGRVATLSTPPPTKPQASSRAPHHIWRGALLHGDPSAIVTEGDTDLFAAMFAEFSALLRL